MKRLYLCGLVVILIVCLTTGCIFSKRRPKPNLTEFSVNLVETPRGYFVNKFLSQAEKEVLDKMGAPDSLRIYWDKVGSVIDEDEALRLLRSKTSISEFNFAWVYVNDSVEVVFPNNYKYEVKDIDDRIRIISQYGDPERTEKRSVSSDIVQEVYIYYSYGKNFVLWNGKLKETREFPPTGKVIK